MPSSYAFRAREVNLAVHLAVTGTSLSPGPRCPRCPPRCYRDLAVTAPGPRCPRCPYAAYAGWVDARTPHSMSGAFSVLVWFNNAYADSVPMVPLGGDEGTRRYEQPAHGTSSCQRSGSPYGCGR